RIVNRPIPRIPRRPGPSPSSPFSVSLLRLCLFSVLISETRHSSNPPSVRRFSSRWPDPVALRPATTLRRPAATHARVSRPPTVQDQQSNSVVSSVFLLSIQLQRPQNQACSSLSGYHRRRRGSSLQN
ncbi:hypothetical protein LINGRAHAP2_LOCUS35472, partial [Linum grandiflorum]